jgi:hypothetical protein
MHLCNFVATACNEKARCAFGFQLSQRPVELTAGKSQRKQGVQLTTFQAIRVFCRSSKGFHLCGHVTSSLSGSAALVISSTHSLAAAATVFTSYEVASACRHICALVKGLPTIPAPFEANEALSMVGVLGSALQATGHACLGDLLAMVLDRSPSVSAASAAASPQCPLLPASPQVQQLTLATEVLDWSSSYVWNPLLSYESCSVLFPALPSTPLVFPIV